MSRRLRSLIDFGSVVDAAGEDNVSRDGASSENWQNEVEWMGRYALVAGLNGCSVILCIATALWWHSGRNAVMVNTKDECSSSNNGEGEFKWREEKCCKRMAGRKVYIIRTSNSHSPQYCRYNDKTISDKPQVLDSRPAHQ